MGEESCEDDSLYKGFYEHYENTNNNPLKINQKLRIGANLEDIRQQQNFQEEFMSRFNEFSLSWRNEAMQLKKIWKYIFFNTFHILFILFISLLICNNNIFKNKMDKKADLETQNSEQ